MRVPDWTKKYSIESSGPVIRTASPVSSPTSRSAVCSVVSPRLRRALGEGPGPAVALATSAAHDQPRLTVFVTDDDPAGGSGGRGPQARHGADAALDRRIAAGQTRIAPSASRHAGAGGRRAIARRRRAGSIASGRGGSPAARHRGGAGRSPAGRSPGTGRPRAGPVGAPSSGPMGARNAPPAGPRTSRRCCDPSGRYGTGSNFRLQERGASRRRAPVPACHGRRRAPPPGPRPPR